MTANTPRSRKAKGRKFQQEIRDIFRQLFKDELEPDDINCTMMSESGMDIKLTPAARKLVPFDLECKRQEKLSIHESLKQAEENSLPNRIPAVIFSRNHSKTYIVMEFNKFLHLVYPERIKNLSNIPESVPVVE